MGPIFDAQKPSMEKPDAPTPCRRGGGILQELKRSALFLQDISEDEEQHSDEIPSSLPVPSDAAIKSINPLPLGHVASGIIQPDSYAYYQLEILTPTLRRLKSVHGYSDSTCPRMSSYEIHREHRVHGGDYNHRWRV